MIHLLGGWPVLDKSWNSPRKLETLLGHLKGDFNQGIIIEQWVGPDDKNSSLNIIQVNQNIDLLSFFNYRNRNFICFLVRSNGIWPSKQRILFEKQ